MFVYTNIGKKAFTYILKLFTLYYKTQIYCIINFINQTATCKHPSAF